MGCSISSNQVSVLADDGIVTLRGSVPHYFEKSHTEAAAQRISGVRAVVDRVAWMAPGIVRVENNLRVSKW
ncbi:MAG: BON domain-containing protein [Pseudobdellovibrionaceae bacterium]